MIPGYSRERNIQIIIALLKANNIKKIIASPGATNYTFVRSLQSDPFFEMYSSVDERSASYMACGLAAESGEPVVLSCTGATASRNYYPGLTEAYYRKLPVLAITSHQGKDRIGQLIFQNIDRSVVARDAALLSIEVPIINNIREENFAIREVNRAILELYRNGGGPVHINVITSYDRDFSVKELPAVHVFKRYFAWDVLPPLTGNRIAVFIGTHVKMTAQQVSALERFCATYDAVAICDHTSGYYGKYRLLPTLAELQSSMMSPIGELDVMIHIGEICAATFSGHIRAKEIWRVSEDGEIRDTYNKLTTVFQMAEEFFFQSYAKDGYDKHNFIDECKEKYYTIYNNIPELPFSNIWIAQQLSSKLPEGALIHIGVSNTRRSWNMFPLAIGVESACNVGCCGIDGCMSTLIGASLANKNRICYLVLGDLTFFYDLNSLGNRHIGKNIRILLINNGIGAEFKLHSHPCYGYGNEANMYSAAGGHFGNKSRSLVKHFAEDLGFEYLCANGKNEFNDSVVKFISPSIGDKSIIFEVFTEHEDENRALEIMENLDSDAVGAAKSMAKKILGSKGTAAVKKLLGKG